MKVYLSLFMLLSNLSSFAQIESIINSGYNSQKSCQEAHFGYQNVNLECLESLCLPPQIGGSAYISSFNINQFTDPNKSLPKETSNLFSRLFQEAAEKERNELSGALLRARDLLQNQHTDWNELGIDWDRWASLLLSKFFTFQVDYNKSLKDRVSILISTSLPESHRNIILSYASSQLKNILKYKESALRHQFITQNEFEDNIITNPENSFSSSVCDLQCKNLVKEIAILNISKEIVTLNKLIKDDYIKKSITNCMSNLDLFYSLTQHNHQI